jgi:hypothetical protein
MVTTPEELAAMPCDHCGLPGRAYQDYGILLVRVFSPHPQAGGEIKHVVCGPCSITLAEYLCPKLLDDAEYISDKDQLIAHYREVGWWNDDKHGQAL